MTDEDIIHLIHTLDEQVSKDSAEAIFAAFGEVGLYANKEGYLRMAVELMKCAFDETSSSADLTYLFQKESDFGIDHFAHTKEELKFLSQ